MEVFPCHECDRKANRQVHLTRRKKQKDTENQDTIFFSCDDCDFMTKRKDHLQRHMKCKHKDKTPKVNIHWKYFLLVGFTLVTNVNIPINKRNYLRNRDNETIMGKYFPAVIVILYLKEKTASGIIWKVNIN